MIIIPAIDLRGGQVVRLTQGVYEKESVYTKIPVDVAQDFLADGANRIHVVDLEGARQGRPTQLGVIEEMVHAVSAKFQIGGGIRSPEILEQYLQIGVSKVILGTRACLDKGFLKECLSTFAAKVIVSVDARDGMIATEGWTQVTGIRAEELLDTIAGLGGEEIIYTDISKDGMLEGPNFDQIKRVLKEAPLKCIASGGVSGIDDIQELINIKAPNLVGAIVGKAIYERKLDLKEAIQLCSQSG